MRSLAFVFVTLLVLLVAASVEAKPKDALSCAICTQVVAMVERHLQNNSTVQQVDALVLQACQRFGVQDWCQTVLIPLVNQVYKTSLIQAGCLGLFFTPTSLASSLTQQDLVGRIQPTIICQKIKQCPAAEIEMALLSRRLIQTDMGVSKGFDLKCSLCEMMIDMARNEINKDSTRDHIREIVQKACNKLPFSDSLCTLIAPMLDTIINDLINKKGTNEICRDIKLCK